MKWIGLTGGIASGKSRVAEILKNKGFKVVDADLIAREVVQAGTSGLKAVVDKFGVEVLLPDGGLDRKKLGRLVFGQPGKLKQLEDILHPLVKKETARQRQEHQEQGHDFVFYDVPLLFEKKMESEFDGILVVVASEALQRERMKNRDHLSEQDIENRLRSQVPLPEKIKKADWVIRNEGSLQDLEVEASNVLRKIQSGKA
jgi:dephospho-CoA kinase